MATTQRFREMTSLVDVTAIATDADRFFADASHAAHHPCPDCDCCPDDLIGHPNCDIEKCPCQATVIAALLGKKSDH